MTSQATYSSHLWCHLQRASSSTGRDLRLNSASFESNGRSAAAISFGADDSPRGTHGAVALVSTSDAIAGQILSGNDDSADVRMEDAQTTDEIATALHAVEQAGAQEDHERSPGKIQNGNNDSADVRMEDAQTTRDEIETAPPAVEQAGAQEDHERSPDKVLSKYERGTLNFTRKQIILDLVDRLGGVYPGDRDLYYAFCVIWMEKNQGAGRPDTRTVMRIQKTLIDAGHIKAFKFSYTNAKGLQCEKKILARLDVQADSPSVKDLEQKMKEAGNRIYIPPEVGGLLEVKRKVNEGYTYGWKNMPKIQVEEDTTSKVTLLHEDPRQVELRERREEQRQEREARKEQKILNKARKEAMRLDRVDQRAAAKRIRSITQIAARMRPKDVGPVRWALITVSLDHTESGRYFQNQRHHRLIRTTKRCHLLRRFAAPLLACPRLRRSIAEVMTRPGKFLNKMEGIRSSFHSKALNYAQGS
ncbi:MAG: hypothetical protein M1826_004212 [Phylliscum demangeonii]|nr:MAG: hypothetical protein M1826_004212 [Phylliscum demangeonii]